MKEDIDFWNELALVTNPTLNFEKLEQLLEENFVATEETTLTNESKEVSFFIVVYVFHCRLRSILKRIVMFVLLAFQDALLM